MSKTNNLNHMRQDEVPSSVHGGGRLATFTIALESWRRGLSVKFLDGFPYRFEISDGYKSVGFDRAMPNETTRQAFLIAKRKSETLEHLRRAGVPTPNSRLINAAEASHEDVKSLALEVGYPVVLKPGAASKGRGVFTNIRDDVELIRYYNYLVDEMADNEIILESFFVGDDYRVQVVGDAVAAVTLRRPASVVGDGQRTIRQLIEEKNRSRRKNPALSKDMLKIDLEVDAYVEDYGYSYQSVPPAGKAVRLRGKANISSGGDIIDVTDWLPDHIRDAAIRAVAAIPGLVSAGVDVLINDEKSRGPATYVVIELNPRAHLGGHIFPSEGPGRNVVGAFIDHYFPSSNPSLPISFSRISFRIDDILAPLRQGSATSVELAPLSSHGYPCRKRIDYPPVGHLSSAEKRRIMQEATRLGVVGTLQCRQQDSRLIAAADEHNFEKFVQYVTKALGCGPTRRTGWSGVIWHGFVVSQRSSSQQRLSAEVNAQPSISRRGGFRKSKLLKKKIITRVRQLRSSLS